MKQLVLKPFPEARWAGAHEHVDHMWTTIKGSLRLGINFSRKKINSVHYFQAVLVRPLRFQPYDGSDLAIFFAPRLCIHCIASSAFLLKCSMWCTQQFIPNPSKSHNQHAKKLR